MKTVFKIGSSEELNSSQAVLLMEVSERHCCYGIIDFANQMMVQLGYYAADEKNGPHVLQKIIEDNDELKQSFRQTIISYYMPENMLIPSKLYRYEETQAMLQSMYETGRNVAVTESIDEWQLYNAYHVPAALHELLGRQFAAGNFWHSFSITLKNGIKQHENGDLLIDFRTDSFSVVAVKGNSLLLAQIFSYVRSEDVLFWLLKICHELSLSQNEVVVVLSGLIDKQSAVFKELYQYFLNIEFETLEVDIQLSGDFEEYPVHFFSSLYKLASCVS